MRRPGGTGYRAKNGTRMPLFRVIVRRGDYDASESPPKWVYEKMPHWQEPATCRDMACVLCAELALRFPNALIEVLRQRLFVHNQSIRWRYDMGTKRLVTTAKFDKTAGTLPMDQVYEEAKIGVMDSGHNVTAVG